VEGSANTKGRAAIINFKRRGGKSKCRVNKIGNEKKESRRTGRQPRAKGHPSGGSSDKCHWTKEGKNVGGGGEMGKEWGTSAPGIRVKKEGGNPYPGSEKMTDVT